MDCFRARCWRWSRRSSSRPWRTTRCYSRRSRCCALTAIPLWTEPLLQEFFVGAYILLAPFAGPFADAFPKGRVMLVSNGLKLAGALGMWMGLNPFLTYGLVGLGAAAYSPAKYGILSELVPPELLVKANGLLESSTIAAILSGAIAGGALADWKRHGRSGRCHRLLCGGGGGEPAHPANCRRPTP